MRYSLDKRRQAFNSNATVGGDRPATAAQNALERLRQGCRRIRFRTSVNDRLRALLAALRAMARPVPRVKFRSRPDLLLEPGDEQFIRLKEEVSANATIRNTRSTSTVHPYRNDLARNGFVFAGTSLGHQAVDRLVR